jgi:subtilisin family serine protease
MSNRRVFARHGSRVSAPRRLAVAIVVPLAALGLGLSAAGSSLAAASPHHSAGGSRLAGHAFVPGQLLVRFASGVSSTTVNRAMGASVVHSYSSLVPGLELVRLRPGLTVDAAQRAYAATGAVRYAQPNWVSHIAGVHPQSIAKTPNDPMYPSQWDWPKIDAPAAWNATTGSKSVVVTDIDTGLDYNHQDLAANAWKNTAECDGTPGVDDDHNGYIDDCHGIDTINGDVNPMDDAGHGTHTAGTIGAVGNNGVGVTGLNWKVQVMPCKSHGADGNGSISSIIECYQYVKTEKAAGYDIIATNNSYGSCPEACDFNPATRDAIAALVKPGVIMSYSAGNSNRDNDIRGQYPANYDLPNIISVAATDTSDNRASFSEYGLRSVDVGAPGVSVLSTLPNNAYGNLSGTSMSAPHVAGLAAMLHTFDNNLTWWQIRNLIIAGGDPVASMDGKTVSGRRINVEGSENCTNTKVFGMLSPYANTGAMTQLVTALNIKCGNPAAGPVSVTITPGNDTLTLTDDGNGGDVVAGDGIFSASWKATCGAGALTFTFNNGKSYGVNVAACAKAKPKTGHAGSNTKVTGSGYTANEIVDIFFDDEMVATTNANVSGKVGTTIKVPNDASNGKHTITVSGQTSGLAATATFKVT